MRAGGGCVQMYVIWRYGFLLACAFSRGETQEWGFEGSSLREGESPEFVLAYSLAAFSRDVLCVNTSLLLFRLLPSNAGCVARVNTLEWTSPSSFRGDFSTPLVMPAGLTVFV